MSRISRKCIDDIKQHVNIYDVVSPVVSLKKSGRNFVGLSPFTTEKTPSFFIHPERNMFKCFSSNYAGDIFRFIELYEKLTFAESVEAIANRFNQPLEYEQGAAPTSESRSVRKEIIEIHDRACDYYHRNFMGEHPLSKEVQDYWTEERKFTLQIAEKYKIGLAPPKDSRLIELLFKQGYSLEALKKCGLFYFRDRETEPRNFKPRFRGRLLVPIRDYQGQVIAFTARQLPITPVDDPSRQAKYINSPETPVFYKSKVIFGLDHARHHVDETGNFVLVEGQLDAIRCWQYGINTAVAPQGTSITESQLLLLKRYTNTIDCVLDGDSAGQKAALRILPMALRTGLEIRFIVLPPDSDPDSLLVEKGKEAFEQSQEQALDAIDFLVHSLLPKKNPSPQAKAEALLQLFEIINESDLLVTQDEYLQKAAGLIGADPVSMRADFNRFKRKKSRKPDRENENSEGKSATSQLTTAEFELLCCVFQSPTLSLPIAEILDVEWIDTELVYGRLLVRVIADIQEGLWEGIKNLDQLLENEEEKNCFYSLLADERHFEDPIKVANACVKAILEKFLRQRLIKLEEKIANLPTPSDKFPQLQRNIIELRNLKKNIPPIQNS